MNRQLPGFLAVGIPLLLLAAWAGAAAEWESDPLNPEEIALTFHKITAKPFDFEKAAHFSPRLAGSPTFDRPDILKGEIARLRAIHDQNGKDKVFTTVVGDSIGQYDHERGLFPIGLFQPGTYVRVSYHYVEYRLVFANTDNLQAIPMPAKEEARAYDQKLQQFGRGVTHVIRFRLIGEGDPQGAVSGERVMLGEIVSLQTHAPDGQVLLTHAIQPYSVVPPPEFVATQIDVAGMRVGVPADDLQPALERLYYRQKVTRVARMNDKRIDSRYAGYIELDLSTCLGGGYRRRAPEPGDICVRAYFDEDEVVRSIIVIRVFPAMDYEIIRRAAIARYGKVSASEGGALAWGPNVDSALLSYRVRQGHALTMNVNSPSDLLFHGGGSGAPRLNVALQLVDPVWAASARP